MLRYYYTNSVYNDILPCIDPRCTKRAMREAVAGHKHHRRVREQPDECQGHDIDEVCGYIVSYVSHRVVCTTDSTGRRGSRRSVSCGTRICAAVEDKRTELCTPRDCGHGPSAMVCEQSRCLLRTSTEGGSLSEVQKLVRARHP